MTRTTKGLLLRLSDLGSIVMANIIALLFITDYHAFPSSAYLISALLGMVTYFLLATYMKVYQQVVRYIGLRAFINLLLCCSGAFISKIAILTVFGEPFSLRFLSLVYLFATFFIISSRVLWHVLHSQQFSFRSNTLADCDRTLIIGTGKQVDLLLTQLATNKEKHTVMGLVDSGTNRSKITIQDISVVGDLTEINTLLTSLKVKRLIIAANLTTEKITELVQLAKQQKIELLQMPSLEEILQSPNRSVTLHEITISDLLERDELKLDITRMKKQIKGQTVLVSGAGGSIGSEIVRQLVQFEPEKLLLLGHGENSIYQIKQELASVTSIPLIPIIADIQDQPTVNQILQKYRPSIVYHAAAHKHVPLMEDNPHAAIKNNVLGTRNIAHAADSAGVSTFVMISSDKAVNPPSVMGATKRLAELIVTNLNHHSKTNFAVVRFGNVLGSRGSVVPLFNHQIAQGGPITLTDFRMTRYFMTIPEASQLVIQAGALCHGGELFILDMGKPVKIYDLAKKMVALSGLRENQIKINEVGMRPGEKLYEELLISGETANQQIHDKIFLGQVMQVEEQQIVSFVKDLLQTAPKSVKQEIVGFACKYNGAAKAEKVV